MKRNIFSLLVLLFGLSLTNVNAQCSVDIQVIPNGCGETFLIASVENPSTYSWNTGSTMSFTVVSVSGLYSVTVCCTNGEYSEANVFVEVDPCNPGGCSFNILEQKNCNSNKLTVTDCPDCTKWSWSNGAQTESINVTSIGIYKVTVTGNGGCTSTASHEVTEVKKANAVISGVTKVCPGMKTTLVASGGVAYKWSTGSTSSSGNFGKGTYTVTVTDASGCTGTKSVTVIELAAPTAPTILASVNQGVVTLLSSVSGGNMWSTNETTQKINPTMSGVYTLKVKNSAGCFSLLVSVPVVIDHSIEYVDTCMSGGNGLEPCQRSGITIKGRGDGAVFAKGEVTSQTLAERSFNVQGYLDNPRWSTSRVDPDNTPLLSYANPGQHEMFFRYKYQNKEYCHVMGYHVLSSFTETDELESRSVKEAELDLEVYPNPTTGILNIRTADFEEDFYVSVTNLIGEKIFLENFQAGEFRVSIDLTDKPRGSYLVSIYNEIGETLASKKVIKQ